MTGISKLSSRLLLAIILISLFSSCSSNVKPEKVIKEKPYKYASMKDGILHLDLKEASKHSGDIKLSQICDSIIYIPLETNKNCLLGGVLKLIIDNNDMFIGYSWGLYHFDINGKFINQLGRKGRGPGEYVCTDFCVNKKDDIVYAKANYRDCLYKFSYEGKFLDSKLKITDSADNLVYNEDNKSIMSGMTYELQTSKNAKAAYDIFKERNLNGEIIKIVKSKYYPNEFGVQSRSYSLCLGGNKHYMYRDNFRFNEMSCDTLFEYSNKQILPKLILNNAEYKPKFTYDLFKILWDNLVKSNGKEHIKMSHTDRNVPFNVVRGESDRYIFISYFEKFIYDKKVKELLCLESATGKINRKLINDFDGIYDFWPKKIVNNKYLYSYISAVDFLEKYNDVKDNVNCDTVYKKRLKQIADEITEESNPILMLARLKK
ncbi:MAG: 6-bladed beta-propeller [Marinifilaceae bacterium]